jgi:putative transposase
MRELGLVACQPRPWRPVTTIAGDAATIPDLVRRDFTADAPGTKLVGDITYIRTWEGWLYLATVIDCHTKACIGYAMADHMRTDLVTAALDMAGANYPLAEDAIFHSDRGTLLRTLPRHSPNTPGNSACAGRSDVPGSATIMLKPKPSTPP